MARSGARLSCLLISVATLTISPAADPADPANPDSKPLKDDSAKAGQDSKPVRDTSKASGNDSRPVQDEGNKANERSQEKPSEAHPITDDSGKASPDARKLVDKAPASGNDSRKVEDNSSNKASPEARRTTDSSRKAGPEAATVNDGNHDKANPSSRPASGADRAKQADAQAITPEEPTVFESETTVREAMTEAESAVRQSKLQISRPEEARAIIDGILAADGPVSRAEQARGNAISDAAASAAADVPEEMRAGAKDHLRDRLSGQPVADRAAPAFFRPLTATADSLRFFHAGRRYVHFHSKTSIPAVLLAQVSLGNVELQTAAEAARFFATTEDPLASLPESYRSADAWVISYPVSKESMIGSGDIVFRAGSTQFANPHAYEMIQMLSEAMKDPMFADQRFIIEGHAAAGGTFEENQILSQQRAEAIARELVRNGVSAEQLIPVGYGQSEARGESRVILFRLDEPDEEQPATGK
jgi:outer membrane protein OmpA-like peptidoglycan-associated protein